MDVSLPDGTIIRGVPEGTTREQLAAKLQSSGRAVPSDWLTQEKPQASQSVGGALREIPRQVGLFGRHAVEGLGQLLDIGAAPLRAAVNPALAAMGAPKASSLADGAASLSDAIGLPKPATADERTVGDAARMVVGAGGGMAAAAKAAATAAPGVMQSVMSALSANPLAQTAGAAGAGLAGGSVRESGGGALEQFGASLLGGVAGGVGADSLIRAGKSAGRAVTKALTPQATQLQRVDQQIALTLERSGVDWSQVPERVRQGMRTEVAAALDQGQTLNADALRRLLVFRRTNTTPTVGQLTQDPGQITRETALAKVGANSTDRGLQRLPALQNENAATLLRQLDEAGAGRRVDAVSASRGAIESLDSTAAAARRNIDGLYSAARDSSGRSAELDGRSAAQNAIRRLDDDGVGKLPPEVDDWLNGLSTGRDQLTVDYQQKLVKNLYRKMRGAQDGDLRHGLGVVRNALDNAEPVGRAAPVNALNLPAVQGTVPPSNMLAADEAIQAYGAARSANRSWAQRLEGSPALRAVVDGVEPDQFVQRFVIGKGATAADVRALHGDLSPQAVQGIRDHLVKHLRDAATGSTDDVVKFGNASYRKALRDIGDDKLALFFNREEMQHLRDIGDAAKYMQAQPSGSAVNNSNSGALMLGRGLDMLDRVASYVPFGGRDIIKGKISGVQQQQVLSPRNALALSLEEQQRGPLLNPLVGLLAASPGVVRGNDNRRN